jgi:hypothetical protein
MQADDFPRFRAVLAGMAKVYERELDGPLLDAYWLALRDWSLPEFEQAAGHLLANSRFMPRPAEFTELRKGQRMTPGEAWAEALDHVRKGLHHFGDKASPDVERAVAAIGGWRAVAYTPEDGLRFLEQRFAKHYAEIRDAVDVREEVPALAADNPVRKLLNFTRPVPP